MKEGWEVKTISNVSEIVNGGTPKTNIKEYWNGSHLWITPAEMGKRLNPYVDTTNRCLSDEGLKKSSAQLLPPFSVILSSRAPIGHLVINEKSMAFNQGCKGIIPNSELYYKYLYYFLFCNVDFLNSLGTGATFKELSATKLKEIKIPIPPLAEQKRIVAILDEAFDAIDRAKARAEKNLAGSRELFESYLNGIFANPGEDWEEKKLGEVCHKITKGSSPKWQGISYVEKPGVMFITSENVGNNEMIYKKVKYVHDSFNKKDSKSILSKGDVLTNIVGASIGRTAIFDKEINANINQAVCMIRCNLSKISNRYLTYLLNSPFLINHLHENEINNARANLSLTFFRELSIPIPLLEKQKIIVTQLDKLSEESKILETIYTQKIAALDELKKSILHKAFEGELN